MKNLILICDGTMQSFAQKNCMVKLFASIEKTPNQLVYYDSGVATVGSFWRRLFDGATGHGLMKNVKEAYLFLCKNYSEGDKIYAFGYSRGAATIRLLVDLVSRVGLLPAHADNLLPPVLQAFMENDEETLEVLAECSPKEAPYFEHVGVLDTCFGNRTETDFYNSMLSDSWKNVVKGLWHIISSEETRSILHPFRWANSSNVALVEGVVALDHCQVAFYAPIYHHFISLLKCYDLNITQVSWPLSYTHICKKPWYDFLIPKMKRVIIKDTEELFPSTNARFNAIGEK